MQKPDSEVQPSAATPQKFTSIDEQFSAEYLFDALTKANDRIEQLELVAQSLIDFQKLYEANTYDKMPGNEHYAGMLLAIVEASRVALAVNAGDADMCACGCGAAPWETCRKLQPAAATQEPQQPVTFATVTASSRTMASGAMTAAPSGMPDWMAQMQPAAAAVDGIQNDEASERKLQELAFGFHVGIEGEYGCPGISCPGVQRLVEKLRELKGVGRFDYQPAAAAQPIDRLDLEPIKAREAAATKGPWKMFNGYGPCPDGRHRVERFGNDDGTAVLATEGRSEDVAGLQADWEFLAHARQDIPKLLAEVARLRALQGSEQA